MNAAAARAFVLLLCGGALLHLPGPAAAQGIAMGVILGTIRDHAGSALPTAVIDVSGDTLIGGPRRVSVNDDGTYRLATPAGTYELTVSSNGFRTLRRSGIRLSAAETVVIDVALQVGGFTDVVAVEGSSPVVDVKNPGSPTRFDQDMLFNLPVSREVSELINLTPGVTAGVSFGASQESNELLLDGVRTTGPLTQAPLARVNYNWVEEVNIVALGAAAEHGGFSGALSSATLRSGGNRFTGLTDFWTTRPNWLANNTEGLSDTLQRQFNSRELLDWHDSSVQLGGPIRRDRVWFFSGIQYARHDDRPAGYTGPGSRDTREVQFIVKPTVSASPAMRLDGFFQRGKQQVDGEYIGPQFPLEASNDIRTPQTMWSANATASIHERTLLELRYHGYSVKYREDPHPPATLDGPYAHLDVSAQTFSQNTNLWIHEDSVVRRRQPC